MSVNILVVNAGSSSLKFRLYEMPSEKELCGGVAERIGEENPVLHWHTEDKETKEESFDGEVNGHEGALQEIIRLLQREEIVDQDDIHLVVHRVVHGGIDFDGPVLITEDVKKKIRELSELAPLHNPVSLRCIEAMAAVFPSVKQAAVFDTSFHHRLPEQAFRYAIPDNFYKDDGVRVYGFHGISHQYVTQQAAAFLQTGEAKLISMHLGNGCSICAVSQGKPVDTSMGFGPVSGLVMATRSGDLDPSVILYLMRKHKLDETAIDRILNKESGLNALCGMTDLRDIHNAVLNGNREAAFAAELYTYRIRKYIGAYIAAMNGLDALIFTGGVGENSAYIRGLVCADMDWLGIRLNEQLNQKETDGIRNINEADASVKILIVPTNEAMEMARQTFTLLSGKE